MKKTNKIWRRRIFKASGLLIVNGFIESVMEKRVFDIKLWARRRKRQDKEQQE
jgi:hypothetical protein